MTDSTPIESKQRALGIVLGNGAGRWIAPAATGWRAVGETILIMVVAMALAFLLEPNNPLLFDTGFPWVWLLPIIIALRYGTLMGALAAALLLGGWYIFYSMGATPPAFPSYFFLGGLLFVLVAGQFGDIWNARLARASQVNSYLSDRLAALTKNHFLLRLSHDRLENDLLARPTTLRDTLTQLRRVAIEDQSQSSLPGSEAFLKLAAQACQLEVAALFEMKDGQPVTQPLVSLGGKLTLDPADPLVDYCLTTRTLAHVRVPELRHMTGTRYLAVAPVLSGDNELLGVVAIEQMPFLSVSHENLQFLMVLLGYYADGVRHADSTRKILATLPECPYEFALDYSRLARLHRDTGMESTVVALIFDMDESRNALYEHVRRSSRALDVTWAIQGSTHRAFLTLMPFAGDSALAAYLVRIEDSLEAQFKVNFEAAHISFEKLTVSADGSEEALRRLLARCHLDA
jgi:hypothetical protein